MRIQESHQKAHTVSWFQILWSTSVKADKSLQSFTEVLPFSAWPAHLILLYSTLTSTIFYPHSLTLLQRNHMERLLEVQQFYIQYWKILSKNQRGGRDSRGNDEHKQDLSVRPFLPRAPFTTWGRGSTEKDSARWYNASICINTMRIN